MADPLLEVCGLTVTYQGHGRASGPVKAVDEVSFELAAGEALGLVGESGCGKSSLARALTGAEPSTGDVKLAGEPLFDRSARDRARLIQLIFQDPYQSLNPRLTVKSVLAEAIRVHALRPREAIAARVRELVHLVGLPESALEARPRSLSGGQRQRVAIARALALEPKILIADEPTTALDVSVQALILELFARLVEQLDLGLLLISHNLAAVGSICGRVAVMYGGQLVEVGPTATLFAAPEHAYTRQLLDAVPDLATTTGGEDKQPW
ncbi:MAG TPA: ATP-binding cassette domain-containing protein [Streptosporangiaceae bacterium]|nr:ATP-binding cassette domain-containing protein [Streptosporangiaceae bacterium]